MDHDSHLYRWLAARQDVSCIMGIILIGVALIFTLTGRCLVKYRGIIHRAEDPKEFWQNIAVYCALGIVCLGIYVYIDLSSQ